MHGMDKPRDAACGGDVIGGGTLLLSEMWGEYLEEMEIIFQFGDKLLDDR